MEECCPTGTSECGGSMCVMANTLLVDGDGEATIRKRTRGHDGDCGRAGAITVPSSSLLLSPVCSRWRSTYN